MLHESNFICCFTINGFSKDFSYTFDVHSNEGTMSNKKTKNPAMEENISVSVRVRPINERETRTIEAKGLPEAWSIPPAPVQQISQLRLDPYAKDGEEAKLVAVGHPFAFDNIFREEQGTGEVYNKVARDVVASMLSGINGTIFAYGQTASGKTHTMQGSKDHPGILRLAARHIFDEIASTPQRQYLLHVSYIEVYNEQVKDLLAEGDVGAKLRIREDREKGFYVAGMTLEPVLAVEELISLLEQGEKRRHVGVTNMNEKSSRSHTIFTIQVESREMPTEDATDGDADFGVLTSRIAFVDLAGSENVRNTGAKGERLKEGGNINKSLLTLSRVISQLASANGSKNAFINFRDSKLTQILQPSLAGNCRTAIVCCVTVAPMFADETRSTLKFASRAKQIKTVAVVNEVLDGAAEMKRLKRTVQSLRKQLVEQQTKATEESDLQAVNDEKALLEEKIDRLKRLLVSGGVAVEEVPECGTEAWRKRRRKLRETWCPGAEGANALEDFPADYGDDVYRRRYRCPKHLLRASIGCK